MSYFELRQYMESVVPWWAPFVLPLVVYLAWCVASWRRRKGN